MEKALLNKEFIEHKGRCEGIEKGEIKIPDSYVKDMTYADMITEFPELVRGGQFVNALAVIQGHGRFNWFYSLLEKVTIRLFCRNKREKPAAEKENVGLPGMPKEAQAK